MSELFTSKKTSILNNKYSGKKVTATGLLYRPIKIHHFEYIDSKYNEGKPCLIAQVSVLEKDGTIEDRMLETEASLLISTIKNAKSNPPYETKIVRNKERALQFTKLNKPELEKLKDAKDPTPPSEENPF